MKFSSRLAGIITRSSLLLAFLLFISPKSYAECTKFPSGNACVIPVNCSGTILQVPCNDCFTPLPGPLCLTAPPTKSKCDFGGSTLFLPRPQGLNSMLFFDPFRYNPCTDQPLTDTLMIGYRFTHTFNGNHIAECLFGAECLSFSGSKSPSRQDTDFVADFFGLSPKFQGSLCLNPSIKNNIVDFSATWQLGNWFTCLCNSYITVNTSLVQSTWDLNGKESYEASRLDSFTDFPTCYMSASEAQATQSIATALSGDFLFGDMQEQWQFGRFILNRSQKKTALANIDFLFGYDFYRCIDYHAGLFFVVSAPTGNRPHARTVFEPIIGNGHHVGVGVGLDAHYDLWYCEDQSISLFINGSVSHLCSDKQWRSFNFKSSNRGISGLDSRYILLKEFDGSPAYTGRLINAINFTTRPISSSFDAIGDASFRFLYRNSCWATGLGYNIYGRSTENISRTDCSNLFANKQFGIKGVTGVCAEGWQHEVGLTGTDVVVNATESQSRIFNVSELPFLVDNPIELENKTTNTFFLNWDSPSDAATPVNKIIVAQDSRVDGQPAPVILNESDIDFKGIPAQLAHSFFAHIDYLWSECLYQPALGIGGYVSFADQSNCHVCTPSEWSVWVRGSCCF